MSIRAYRLPGLLSLWGALTLCLAEVPNPPPPYAPDLARADSLLRAGKPEEALAPILAAHAAGMSDDSLYWMLSETASRKDALDTAMGFNLAIRTPAAGPFRDSVLSQRYRLYLAAGLSRDAAALRDSLPAASSAEKPAREKRPLRFTARLGPGWFREENAPAHAAPFGTDLGRYSPSGPEYRFGAGLEGTFARTGKIAWLGGAELQNVKSFAKDSLDSRLAATLREEGWLLPGLILGVGAGGGRVTGSGWVSACKGDASWLSLNASGITVIMSGIEAEWDEDGKERYQTAWLAWYRDATSASGRGFAFSAGLSGFRSDPIADRSAAQEIYVDDARSASPTHYSDSTYASAISPPSKRLAYQMYTQSQGTREVSSLAPQSFLAFTPQASYAVPLPGKFAAELSLSLSGSWYPEPYRRDHAPLPGDAPPDAGFRGLARSRADGREYAAVLNTVSGGFEERYGAEPLRRETRTRLEGQGTSQVTLRRPFGGWGTLSLAAMAKRYVTNMDDAAPIWIPEWDAGVSLAWNGAWEW